MSTEEVFVQQFARLFVHYHDALTQDQFTPSQRQPREYNEFSRGECEQMVAAARLALIEIESAATEEDSRRYFAKPGEAEWGC
jgi:hypothetical protein